MPYQLKFSDPTKTTSITVPDMPPGINTVDTSLSLIGKGYPNYGQATAQNFVNLLENFAGPFPPQNPIEGQLWYDTSDPLNKKLRIMDGSATAARWPSANGIYQQAQDPQLTGTVSLKNGDIWVDTNETQLKIYSAGAWTVVGPSASGNATGAVVASVTDVNGSTHNVILEKSNGTVVSIISADAFTPNPVIAGFSSVQVGITLNSNSKITGTIDKAQQLSLSSGVTVPADNFLRKDDSTIHGQTITGGIYFSTPSNQSGAANRDGIVINVAGQPYSEYVQFYKDITTNGVNSAVVANSRVTGNIVLRISNSNLVTVAQQQVAIATNLAVIGGIKVTGAVTATNITTNNLSVSTNTSIANNLFVGGVSTMTGTLTLGTSAGSGVAVVPKTVGTYDIGTVSTPFRTVYAQNIYASNFNPYPGTLQLWAGATPPSGWLACDGSNVLISTYRNLYAAIGTLYEVTMPPSGYFTLPKLVTTGILQTPTAPSPIYIIKY